MTSQEYERKVAEIELQKAQFAAEYAREEYDITRSLATRGAESEANLRRARLEAEQAHLNLALAEVKVIFLAGQVGPQ